MINPTKVKLTSCRLNGHDIREITSCSRVYETMCKPYITAQLDMTDNVGLLERLKPVAGDELSFSFMTQFGKYNLKSFITSIQPNDNADRTSSPDADFYTIFTVSEGYYSDKANITQRSDVNTTATDIISKIHGQFLNDAPLNVMMSSLGLFAKSEIGGYVSNKRPFTAIEDIMKQLTYAGVKSNSPVFFRNKDEYVLAPLEMLFQTCSPQQRFEEIHTAGYDWRHVFTMTNLIMDSKIIINEKGDNEAPAAKGSQSIFDPVQALPIVQQLGIAGVGAFGKFLKGNVGGTAYTKTADTRMRELTSDASINRIAETVFQMTAKAGVNYKIQVPIDNGINCTVGKGIYAKLIPAKGDLTYKTMKSNYGGNMLVADLVHECYYDKREVMGTTTFRTVEKIA